ncbi:MAG TPA: hypothetical protein VHG52_03735 [Thermomicrobiales bacterium]|nr:hypothetical protein [Thermomicrobiales bacterium]
MVQRAAAQAGIGSVDVDATSALGGWLAAQMGGTDDRHVPISSLWLPANELRLERSRSLMEKISERQPDAAPSLVVTLPVSATLHELTRYLELAARLPQGWRVVLGLPSTGLKGGRPHLVQLGGIRRFAEEWDLSVAIDLAGQFDPTWEAEAAIARLGERLRLLRISASAPSRAAVGRDRVACRALHAAIDGDHRLDVAVVPAGLVPFPITPRVASHGARRAVEYIAERAALHARALREGISRYEGSPSTRGI